ncbi:Chemotaxis protein CheC, inhibitor of MCP methylation [Archaeoglobus fulgidus DSM 8774]|uniref:Chemotaxis protein CheC, inhibitor of MCP methylation n=1 Tax=Archaeoglobus fulgidus DSM 8774 TaxID=1344584 RepID=A0A075WK00_ARCFL|nr:chemotaxis protein CheC [Archaeoglobus fulgidus]AIG97918.1 Chemotaxis protein CheC, inhibitor of MCP methylation [Archaeoglobus fulgidus DSM 8774]
MHSIEDFGEMELDALKELGNIGVGKAATSLSQMLGRRIEMSVPEAVIVKIPELHKYINAEEMVAGVVTGLEDIENGHSGFLYITFPEKSSKKLAEILLGDSSDEEMVDSTLMEIGNILSSSFCDAAAEMLGIVLLPTPPSFGRDFAIAVIDAVVSQLAEKSDYVVIFETKLEESENEIEALVMLIPNEKFVSYILKLLGMVE